MTDADSGFDAEQSQPVESRAVRGTMKQKDWLQNHEARLEALENDSPVERLLEMMAKLTEQYDALREEVKFLKEGQALHHAMLQGGKIGSEASNQIGSYDGDRDDKALDNFLWDVDEYLSEVTNLTDAMQVKKVTSCLTGSAKLWWRTHLADERAGKNVKVIKTWADLKGALRDQFRPGNSDWVNRARFDQLKHTGTVRDYVKQFRVLDLECDKLGDWEKFFLFMRNLQPWAAEEVRRHQVQSLAEAITVAEGLLDYKGDAAMGFGGAKSDSAPHFRPKNDKRNGDRKAKKQKSDETEPVYEEKEKKRNRDCFLCGKPDHFARECPDRMRVNAMLSQEESVPRIGALVLNSLYLSPRSGSVPRALDRPELCFIEAILEGCKMKALIDSGASHSFVSVEHARRLGLQIDWTDATCVTVDASALRVCGAICNVSLQLGAWHGSVDLVALEMDRYDLILGLDFLRQTNVVFAPCWGCVMILDARQTCFVPILSGADSAVTSTSLSSMQDVYSPSDHVAVADSEQHGLLYIDDFAVPDLSQISATSTVGTCEQIQNVHDLRRFLGVSSFCRSSFANYSEVVRPLLDCLHGDWVWGEQQQNAVKVLVGFLAKGNSMQLN